MFGGKGNSRGNASVSVGEGWPPHSITEVSGFKPQSALKRPQAKRASSQVGIFLIFIKKNHKGNAASLYKYDRLDKKERQYYLLISFMRISAQDVILMYSSVV